MTDIERSSADEWAKDGTYRRIYNLARANNHAQMADIVAVEIDGLTAQLADAEAKRAEAIQTGLALTVERDALRADLESARPKAKAWDRMVKLHEEGWSVEYSMANARRLAKEEGTTL